MARSVRMADIAEKLGISIVSVSKGLSGKEGISDALRERVIATARELGYGETRQPSSLLSAGKSIGVLIADRFFNENAFYYTMYRDIVTCCQGLGLVAMLEIITAEAEKACELPALTQAGRVDGLIFMGELSLDYVRKAAALGLPYVLLDFYKNDLPADNVISDNVHGSYLLTRHLLDSGRRGIAFVGSCAKTSSIMDRYLGYCKALIEAGLEPRADWRLEDRDDTGAYIPFVLPRELPDAFVCSCDEVAYNLVEFLTGKGFRVPQDIAVCGYDDFRYATLCRPALTTYSVNIARMAESAVSVLNHRLKGEPVEAPVRIVPGSLILREST